MRRIILAVVFALCSVSANAQFLSGQVLTAAGLNSALAAKTNNASAAITGGTITGLSAPIPLGSGGTGCAIASGTCLDNITGFGSTGFLERTGTGTYTFVADPLPVSHGGTGATSQGAALSAILGASAVPLANGGTNATTATGAASQLQYQTSGTGAVSRTYQSKFSDTVSVLDFGADPTNTVASDTAFANWYAYLLATGSAGYIPKGTYKMASQVTWDQKLIATTGVKIYGDGVQQSWFNMMTTTAPAFSIINSNNSGAFYSTFKDFGIKANVAGPALMIGQENYADAMNEFGFDLYISNASTSTSAAAVEVNYCANCHAIFTANTSGSSGGDALRLRQSTFSDYRGSFSNAGNSIHITNGYNYGNTIISPDLEVSGTNLTIDSANATNNTIIGGQWQWTTATVNATAGSNNRLIGNNFGTGAFAFTNATGIIMYGPNAVGGETLGGLLVPFVSSGGTGSLDFRTGGGTQVQIQNTAGANHALEFTGSNGGNPTISANAGNVAIGSILQANFGALFPPVTVGALPTCNSGATGTVYVVSDSSSPTYNASLTGGGSTKALALCNGSAWTAH